MTAPVATCVAFGSTRLFVVVAGVAYLAAIGLGTPFYVYLRHRGWPSTSRSLLSATVAGLGASLALVALVLIAFPPQDFLTNPGRVLSLSALGVAWGLGLGLIAGAALSMLLRRGAGSLSRA